ncbi:MAG: FAD-binding oxidoreductase [Lachnotalea sp.]
MKIKRYLWFLLYILAALLPSIIYITGSLNLSILIILSGVFGISSYVLFSFQLLLTSRVKIIDKTFGLDKIYRFHMVIAILALVFAYIHKLLKELYYSESLKTQLGDIAFVIFLAVSIFSVLMMINKLFFKISLIDYIRNYLKRTLNIKYQNKVLLHNIILVGLIILLVHILLAYSVNSNLLLKITLIIYFIVPFALYVNHKIIKVYLMKNKKYTVAEVINESNHIVTLKFKPQNGELFSYLPGQFVYIRIDNPQIPRDEHPFTISSSPSQTDYVSVTAKKLGDFTNKLNHVNVGDHVYIDGAFGTFSYLEAQENKKICFIAGGIGITPFLGMLRYMKSINDNKDVVLLWGARDLSEVICKNELDDYVTTLENFKFVPVLSNDSNFTGEKGFISSDVIQKYVESIHEYDFYICGPPIMLESQLKNLKMLGVSKKNIHFERFAI